MNPTNTWREPISSNDNRSPRSTTPFSSLGAMQPPPSGPLPPTPWQAVKSVSDSPTILPTLGARQLLPSAAYSKNSHSSNSSSSRSRKTSQGSLSSRKDSSPVISPLIEAVRAKFENAQHSQSSKQRPLSFTGRGIAHDMSTSDDQSTTQEEESASVGSLKPIISELEEKHRLEQSESPIPTLKSARRNPTNFQEELQKHNQRKFSESNPTDVDSSLGLQRPRSSSQTNIISRELIPSQLRTSKSNFDINSVTDSHAPTTLLNTESYHGIAARVIESLTNRTPSFRYPESSATVDNHDVTESLNGQEGRDNVIRNFSINPPIPGHPTGMDDAFARLRPFAKPTEYNSHFRDFDLDDYIGEVDGESKYPGDQSGDDSSAHFVPPARRQTTGVGSQAFGLTSSRIDRQSASHTPPYPEIRSQSALAIYSSHPKTPPQGFPSAFSSDRLVQSLRSLSRLSGLSHVSGAAFLITQDNNSISGDGDSSGKSFSIGNAVETRGDIQHEPVPRVGEVVRRHSNVPEINVQTDGSAGGITLIEKGKQRESFGRSSVISDDELTGYPSYVSDELRAEDLPSEQYMVQSRPTSSTRQLTPIFTKTHPADERYNHTYRLRHDSTTNEPVLVPVYDFPRPGSFPNRNNLTSPKFSPGFVNSTRAFSTMYHGNSDSSEELIPKHQANQSWSTSSSCYSNSIPPAVDNSAAEPSRKLSIIDKLRSSLYVPPKENSHNIDSSKAGTPLRELPSPFLKTQGCIGSQTPIESLTEANISSLRGVFTIPEVSPAHQHSRNPPEYTHIRQFSFSKYGRPTLMLNRDGHTGKDIEKSVSPDRYERQQRIGRALILCCLIFPPLWIVIASGRLDPLVAFITNGEISTVGRSEKRIAAVMGGSLFFGIVLTIVIVSILVL